jgi:hypothetical protein
MRSTSATDPLKSTTPTNPLYPNWPVTPSDTTIAPLSALVVKVVGEVMFTSVTDEPLESTV